MTTDLDVIYPHPGSKGWAPVTSLVSLAARTLDGDVIAVDGSEWKSNAFKLRALLPRVKRGSRKALFICPYPAHLQNVLESRWLFGSYETVSAWVIDSFWTDRIPMVARHGGRFDHIYVTNPEDVEPWSSSVSAEVKCLPWGTDALAYFPATSGKINDLVRVGRQPDDWDDDLRTLEISKKTGVRFLGRPEFGSSDSSSQKILKTAMNASKVVLAFSNSVDRAYYTHQGREYLTGRWTDALSSGCVVAGRRPVCAAAEELLWDGATLEISSTLGAGMTEIKKFLDAWTPVHAIENQLRSLERLDWRHRLKVIADDLELRAPVLKSELVSIDRELKNSNLYG